MTNDEEQEFQKAIYYDAAYVVLARIPNASDEIEAMKKKLIDLCRASLMKAREYAK